MIEEYGHEKYDNISTVLLFSANYEVQFFSFIKAVSYNEEQCILFKGATNFMNLLSEYEQVKEFHDTFHPSENLIPTAFTPVEALHRASFTTEEMIEFLYASVGGDPAEFDQIIAKWQENIQQTVTKIKTEAKPVEDVLIGQVDALIDANYFNYGSFVLMGVNPQPVFHFVHQANMGKLFPDGKPHYREGDGKVLKPENWEADFAPEGKIKTEIERQKQL